MVLKDDYLEAKNTITLSEFTMIPSSEYSKLVKLSKKIKKELEEELNCSINESRLTSLYVKNRIRDSKNIEARNNIQKEILLGNIFLPDDIKIADLLCKNRYTIGHLKTIIRFRSMLKNIILNSTSMDDKLKEQFVAYKKIVSELVMLFKVEFGIDDQTIILNRICDLLVRHPNYFDTKENSNNKVR